MITHDQPRTDGRLDAGRGPAIEPDVSHFAFLQNPGNSTPMFCAFSEPNNVPQIALSTKGFRCARQLC